MNYKQLSFSLILFFVSSSVYGYFTGSRFFIKNIYLNSPIFDITFFVVIVFSTFATASLQSTVKPAQHIYPVCINILFICLLAMIFSLDLGSYFRLYVSPLSFFALFVFSFVCYLRNKLKPINRFMNLPFVISAFISFSIGFIIYLFKNNFIIVGNGNFAIQMILSMLCIVLPVFFLVYANKRIK